MKDMKQMTEIPGNEGTLKNEQAREILYGGLEEAARARGTSLEIFHETRNLDHFSFENRDLKQSQHKESEGWGLRVLRDGRMGISSTTESSRLMEALLLALEMAPLGPTSAASLLPPATSFSPVKTFDQKVADQDINSLIDIGREVVDRVLDDLPDANVLADVYRVFELKSVRNNQALKGSYLQSLVVVFVSAKLVKEGDILSCSESSYSCRWDPEHIMGVARKLVEKVRMAHEISFMNTGQCPVLFTGSAINAILLPLLSALNGRGFLEGISILQSRMDKETFSSNLTVVDDSTMDFLPGSSPFDDEGTPSRRTVLVENGIPSSIICDLETAARLKVPPTGNGYRRSRSGGTSFAVMPHTTISNITVSSGSAPLEEIIRMVDDGLLVNQVMGAGRGDIQNGDYSVNVYLGYRIKNGQIAGRVKNTMVSGNILEDLNHLLALGDTPYQPSSNIFCPAILVDDVSVSA